LQYSTFTHFCTFSQFQSSVKNGNDYVANLECYAPRDGDFWISVEQSNYVGSFIATVTVSSAECPSGMGGPNCEFKLVNLATLSGSSAHVLDAKTTHNYNAYDYYYVESVVGDENTYNVTFAGDSAISETLFRYVFVVTLELMVIDMLEFHFLAWRMRMESSNY
jgi:hypothetical protein